MTSSILRASQWPLRRVSRTEAFKYSPTIDGPVLNYSQFQDRHFLHRQPAQQIRIREALMLRLVASLGSAVASMVLATAVGLPTAGAVSGHPLDTPRDVNSCVAGKLSNQTVIALFDYRHPWELYCGDLRNIARKHSPVTNTNGFLNCLQRTLLKGDSADGATAANGAAWDWNYFVPGRARALYDKTDFHIYNFYTDVGKNGADWNTCQRG